MPKFDPQRRIILGRGLAVGCVLVASSIMPGCGRKESNEARTDSSTGAGESTSPANTRPESPSGQTQAPAEPDTDGDKISKEKANYQEQPKGNQQCSNCMQFVAESNTCQLVKGEVRPNGWCKLWVANS